MMEDSRSRRSRGGVRLVDFAVWISRRFAGSPSPEDSSRVSIRRRPGPAEGRRLRSSVARLVVKSHGVSFGSAKAREVLEAQQNLSLLDPVAAIVIRQRAKLAKAEVEELAENLDSVGGGPTIVFWDEKLDKRIKLFRADRSRWGRDRVRRSQRTRSSRLDRRRSAPPRTSHRTASRRRARRVGRRGPSGLALDARTTVDRRRRRRDDRRGRRRGTRRFFALTRDLRVQDAISARAAAKAVGVFRQLLTKAASRRRSWVPCRADPSPVAGP